jgi:hypothetical protein
MYGEQDQTQPFRKSVFPTYSLRRLLNTPVKQKRQQGRVCFSEEGYVILSASFVGLTNRLLYMSET